MGIVLAFDIILKAKDSSLRGGCKVAGALWDQSVVLWGAPRFSKRAASQFCIAKVVVPVVSGCSNEIPLSRTGTQREGEERWEKEKDRPS